MSCLMMKKESVFSFIGVGEVEEPIESKVKELEAMFNISDEKLMEISNQLLLEFHKGLRKETNPLSTVKMIPTYVQYLPTGNEEGLFLGLDLGGVNFRVAILQITLNQQKKQNIKSDSQIYNIPENIRTGECDQFFDFVVSSLVDFIDSQNLKGKKLPLGFNFSLPCRNDNLHHAELIQWKKDFAVQNMVGKDVAKLLKDAVKRNGKIELGMVTVINDTVGVMVSVAVDYVNCFGGYCIGLGTNACYMEKISNIETVDTKVKTGEMCINTELGGFGGSEALDQCKNEYDVKLCEENDQNFTFENMTSGLHIAELVRLVLSQFTKNDWLFRGTGSHALTQKGGITVQLISQIEGVMPSGCSAVQATLSKIDLPARKTDCIVAVRVCKAVTRRAAHLTAAAITALARKTKQNRPEENPLDLVLAVDGVVFKHHPTFREIVDEKVKELCRDAGVTVTTIKAHEPGVTGAALVAATADHLAKTPLRD